MFRTLPVMLLSWLAVQTRCWRKTPPTEAPAGFDTPTLVDNPGSQSASNGILEPPGDSFSLDQKVYETTHDVN